MKKLSVIAGVVLLVGCGSTTPTKDSSGNNGSGNNGSSNNGGSPNNGGSNNGGSNNGGNNGASNNGSPNNSTGQNNPVAACEVITSEVDTSYCNLQAVCDSQELYLECEGDGEFFGCYCGDEFVEVSYNPCETPDASAVDFAAFCGLTDSGADALTGCVPDMPEPFTTEYSCAFSASCEGTSFQHTVACMNDDGFTYCECFQDGDLVAEFETDAAACEFPEDEYGWLNEGCGWNLNP